MSVKFTQLQCKEVICVSDGRRLGFISDVQVKVPEGTVSALVVPGQSRCMGLAGPKEDYIIPGAFDKRVAPAVASAVMECAKAQGVARG